MGIKFTNYATTALASGIAAGDLSLAVTGGTGALFPSLETVDYFFCTLSSGATKEIVKVTARSTDTFTIVRAQEGTAASAFLAGTSIELRLTSQGISDVTNLQYLSTFKGGII